MRILPLLPFLLLTLLATLSSNAESPLSFDSLKKSVTVEANALKTTVPYTFENTSKNTVTISRWDSACSCLNARIKGSKMTYKPGEKGEIRIDFELGSFSGTQAKTVMLWTEKDSAASPSIILTAAVTIPTLFEISPKSLVWDMNDTKEPKTFKIKVHDDKPINISNHNGTNDTFPYTIKTIKEGWEYEITVTPSDVSTPSIGMIKINTDSKIKRYQRQQAFVYVRTKKK